jgi:hypothetical protein
VNTIIDSVQQEDSGEGDAHVRVKRTYIKDRAKVARTVPLVGGEFLKSRGDGCLIESATVPLPPV